MLQTVLAGAVLLLVAGLAVAQTPPSAQELKNYTGLHRSAARGDAAEIRRLISQGADPNAKDGNGRTPLHVAAFGSHAAAARALVQGGAKPNALDAQRYDIVTIAAVKDDVKMVQLTLALGASPRNITSPYEGTALIAAAHLGHIDNLGWTAAIEAVILGNGGKRHVSTLRALVDAGANVNIADRQGVGPLAHARARGYAEMVSILEKAGGRWISISIYVFVALMWLIPDPRIESRLNQ